MQYRTLLPNDMRYSFQGCFTYLLRKKYREEKVFYSPASLSSSPASKLYENLMCATDQSDAYPKHRVCTSQYHLFLRILLTFSKTVHSIVPSSAEFFSSVFVFVAVLCAAVSDVL